MDIKEIEKRIYNAVEEYLDSPEAWEEAQLTINRDTLETGIVEIEEADNLPENVDSYNMMDFVEMTPSGDWKADKESIAEAAADYAE